MPIPNYWIDVNGDGRNDFVFASDGGGCPNGDCFGTWQIQINTGAGFAAPTVVTNAAPPSGYADVRNSLRLASPRIGTVGGSYRYATHLPVVDVDSDGRPELLFPARFALQMCRLQLDTDPRNCNNSLATTPDAVVSCWVWMCPEDPSGSGLNAAVVAPSPGRPPGGDVPVSPAYQHGFGSSDSSTYEMGALRFQETSPGSFTAVNVPTYNSGSYRIVMALDGTGSDSEPLDLYGDGLSDVITRVGCRWRFSTAAFIGTVDPRSIYKQPCWAATNHASPATLPDGTPWTQFESGDAIYVNENVGAGALTGLPPLLPDLMTSVVNGVGDRTNWNYYPLSSKAGRVGNAPTLYGVRDAGYLDAAHFFFSSSMAVVGEMIRSNGVDNSYGANNGFRSASYGYVDAVYNHLGRGFQGFRQIIEQNDSAGTGPNSMRTVTTYEQKFPLTGKPTFVTTGIPVGAAGVRPIRTEQSLWACDRADRTAACAYGYLPTGQYPYLSAQVVNTFDLASVEAGSVGSTTPIALNSPCNFDLTLQGAVSAAALTSQTLTCNFDPAVAKASSFDDYGNVVTQTALSRDATGGPKGGFIDEYRVRTDLTLTYGNVGVWWLDQLIYRTTTVGVRYNAGHPMPAGASAPDLQTVQAYQWNGDRTLDKQWLIAANDSVQTAYTYPSANYGLPATVTISGTGVTNTPNGTAQSRPVSLTYTADGYFAASTTDALTHTSYVQTRPSDGQFTTSADPNGIRTNYTYDAFGRMLTSQKVRANGVPLAPMSSVAWNRCSGGGSCNGGGAGETTGAGNGETLAAYRVTTVSDGSATHVAWYDRLGREVKSSARGFDGKFIQIQSVYDAQGRLAQASEPFFDGGTAYWTTSAYDRMGRTTQKSGQGAEMDAAHGNMLTTYTYDGQIVRINAVATGAGCPSATTPNLCLSLSRMGGVTGKLLQTTDANQKKINFWFDAKGQTVAIVDAKGSLTASTFDALGRRLQLADPNMGTWNYVYNALGELWSQTDARGVFSQITGRDALGRMLGKTSTMAPGLGLASETTEDVFQYDAAGGIGMQASTTRRVNGTQVWQEQYQYDDAERISRITTIVKDEPSAGLSQPYYTQYSYDAYYGREKLRSYPSTLNVGTQYTDYGDVKQLINPDEAQTYWSIVAKDAWGHIKSQLYGNGATVANDYFLSTGQARTQTWKLGANGLEGMSYGYDSFGNLIQQGHDFATAPNGPFAQSELFNYDALQRLKNATLRIGGGNPSTVTYSYDDVGNLLSKSDFQSSYAYQDATHPNRVTAAGSNTYSYDANGNRTGSGVDSLAVAYDTENLTRRIQRYGLTNDFQYTPAGQRYQEVTSSGRTSYFPAGLEKITSGGKSQWRHELGDVTVLRQLPTPDQITFLARDRLGSAIARINPVTVQRIGYDAFGKMRGFNGTAATALAWQPYTTRGFAGQEHLDDVRLIHMNGRVYDYNLGRFLSLDPVVQNTENMQSLNGYSYIGNNPLSGIDPSGYSTCQASERVSESDCGKDGVHTIINANGSKSTLIVGEKGDNIALVGTTLNVAEFKDLSKGSINIAYNPSNGADDWVKNGPAGASADKDASSIKSGAASGKGCAGGIACYSVHRDIKSGRIESFARTFSVQEDVGAINGITNDLGRALVLTGLHVAERYGASNFNLVHNPTEGFLIDIYETAQDKAGVTTEIAKRFSEVLASVDHPVRWIAHSQGGAIFAEAARYAINQGSNISNNSVAFDSGANNAWATNRILVRGGIQLFGRGYYDAPNDAVPQIVGLRGLSHPINIIKSVIDFPKLFGQSSPHTGPVPN